MESRQAPPCAETMPTDDYLATWFTQVLDRIPDYKINRVDEFLP